MRRQLPSLNGLRAFEAAARHLSFTRAAEVLFVSQAAVSHQIKALEQQLGQILFRRKTRALELTDAGRRLYPPVQQAFDLLEQGVQDVAKRKNRQSLNISVLPSFASGWMVQRLGRFTARFPEIQVRLEPNSRLTDFQADDTDICIRYGLGNYPDLTVEHLMDEDLFPVCVPSIAEDLHSPEDLAGITLLHDDSHAEWRTWLEACGVDFSRFGHGIVYTDAAIVIQAALEGQGVALARRELCRESIQSGRLVRPFEFSLTSPFAYYLVYPEHHAERPELQAFRAWLFEEVAIDQGRAG